MSDIRVGYTKAYADNFDRTFGSKGKKCEKCGASSLLAGRACSFVGSVTFRSTKRILG